MTERKQLDLAALPPVLNVEQAGEVLDSSRTAAYELIRSGAWPTLGFQLGRLIRIPTAPVLKLLGIKAEVASARPENAIREAG